MQHVKAHYEKAKKLQKRSLATRYNLYSTNKPREQVFRKIYTNRLICRTKIQKIINSKYLQKVQKLYFSCIHCTVISFAKGQNQAKPICIVSTFVDNQYKHPHKELFPVDVFQLDVFS